MNLKSELVKTLKKLVSVYFGKVYTADEIKVSDKTIGGKVELINADGSLAVAADGEYFMEDGFHFIVKDGLIETILDKEGNPIVMEETTETLSEDGGDYLDGNPDVPSSGDTVSQDMDITEDVTNIESSLFELYNRVMEQEQKIAALEQMISDMSAQKMESEKTISQFNEIVNELNNNIKTLASVPVQFSKTDNSVKENEEKQTRLNGLVSILSNKK